MSSRVGSVMNVLALAVLLMAALGVALLLSGGEDLAAQAPMEKQEGIAYVSWWYDQYESSTSDASLAELEETGAGWISLLVTWYQDTITSTTIFSEAQKTPTDAGLIQAIETAHDLGLKVMLKPHLDLWADPAHWRGQIGDEFTTQAEWDAWFASYQDFINYYADLAEANGVEQFCVGTELEGTVAQEMAWREAITGTDGVRQHFSGDLVYAANWTYENTVGFWDALDMIGIDAYYTLTNKTDPTVEELKMGWTRPISFLRELSETWDKPIIFTEIGYRSVDGAAMHPWEYGTNPAIDLQEQADAYQATFESVFDEDWFAGMFWWSWDTNPMQGGPCDNGFTPKGKPAEVVLREWYEGDPMEEEGGVRPRPDYDNVIHIFTDTFASDWQNWSWDTAIDWWVEDPAYEGQASMGITTTNWGALSMYHDPAISVKDYGWLAFYIQKTDPTHPLRVYTNDAGGGESPKVNECNYIVGQEDGWSQVLVPLADISTAAGNASRFNIQEFQGTTVTYFIDDIRLIAPYPIELSEGTTQQAEAGDVVTYSHTVANFSGMTHTVSVEASSERNWPVMLYGGDAPQGTAILPLELGPGVTTTIHLEVTVPLTETGGVTETTTLTATSVTDPTYFDVAYDLTALIITERFLYLPILMRQYP